MDRARILEQINALPEKTGIMVRFGEMAKDLQEVMKDDEVIEGVIDACEKNVTHFVKNTRMIRSFMAVTNKNIYVISRGRMILNSVSLIDKTIVISRKDIIKIERKDVNPIFKLFYAADILITTNLERYEIYLGLDYEKYLPSALLEQITEGQEVMGDTCTNCGSINAAGAKFCSKCGSRIPEKQMSQKQACSGCGMEIEEGVKFCPNCGTPIPEKLEEKRLCVQCGYELSENAKFCPNCGTPVPEKTAEESDNNGVICEKCGAELERGIKFCPNCGNSLQINH